MPRLHCATFGGQGVEAMIDLALMIIWLTCALPIAMLIGHCTLSEAL